MVKQECTVINGETGMHIGVDGVASELCRSCVEGGTKMVYDTKEKQFTECLLISGLGKQKIILGLPWLTEHNPIINWKIGEMKWDDTPKQLKQYVSVKKQGTRTKDHKANN